MVLNFNLRKSSKLYAFEISIHVVFSTTILKFAYRLNACLPFQCLDLNPRWSVKYNTLQYKECKLANCYFLQKQAIYQLSSSINSVLLLSIAIQLEHDFGVEPWNIELIRISHRSTETYLQLNEIFICFPKGHFAPIRVQNCDFICLIGEKM